MENLTVLSPQQMLQGQAAGVQVVQSSGLLGGATVVKIMLLLQLVVDHYVIDGVPLNDGLLTNGLRTGFKPIIRDQSK
jgi:hypothetical protein